jgi:hypothetical protein
MDCDEIEVKEFHLTSLDTYPFALGAHGKKRFQLYFAQLLVVSLESSTLRDGVVEGLSGLASSESLRSLSK